jgi:Rha family phage regulatory protein
MEEKPMQELTIIKQNGGAYIDSREVAKAIGKPHNDLMKAIRKYSEYLTEGNFSLSEFFVISTYFDSTGRELPCYLLTKMGCEMVANKLTGEKGVWFTAAYVKKFNMMETAEREAEIRAHARPRLGEFNSAVRNVLNGMSQCFALPKKVMAFLRGVYEPLGIEVASLCETESDYFTVTEIAECLNIYSETGRPHGHAVSAIISKLADPQHQAVAIPYGLVGFSMRYDSHIIEKVRNWLEENNFPRDVPHLGFEYHLYYNEQLSLFENNDDDALNFNIKIQIKI